MKNTPGLKNRRGEQVPIHLSLPLRVRRSYNHFHGSTHRIMHSGLRGAYRENDCMLSNSKCGASSIASSPPQELLALAHHPAASRVTNAIVDGPTIPHRSRRALLRAMEAQFADVIDDRIGARVGARCWAAADPYLKVRRASISLLLKSRT